MMLDFVVDTGVLMIASGKSDQPCQVCHTALLTHISETDAIFLALDAEGHVLSEYSAKLRHGTIGMEWLRLIGTRGKIQIYGRGKLKKSTFTKLQKAHFDTGDSQFVRLVIVTSSRRLISEDDDYSPLVCRILKQEEKVIVHVTSEACDVIQSYLVGPGEDIADS
jgi:hypothetical protein